jgi:Ca2+-binding EF-hand superfamily protein
MTMPEQVLIPGTRLDDPYRQGQIHTPRRTPPRVAGGGLEPEPEPKPEDDAMMKVLPGGLTLGEATRLKKEAEALRLNKEARRTREVLEMVRDKIEAKSKRLTSTFRQFDANHDGVVSYDEFREGLFNLGVALSEADFTTLVETVDIDGEGTVDYTEFACVPSLRPIPAFACSV